LKVCEVKSDDTSVTYNQSHNTNEPAVQQNITHHQSAILTRNILTNVDTCCTGSGAETNGQLWRRTSSIGEENVFVDNSFLQTKRSMPRQLEGGNLRLYRKTSNNSADPLVQRTKSQYEAAISNRGNHF
jgi:hypothetical protein